MSVLDDALAPLPPPLRAVVRNRLIDSMASDTQGMLKESRLNPTNTLLAGIASNEEFLSSFKGGMRGYEADARPAVWDEIVIGGGIHAAIYCANRPGKKILVMEARESLGGVMESTKPMFYLNSRNRPLNEYDIPGKQASLNHLPGCGFQAADVNGAEYQTNNVMSFVAAANIMLNSPYVLRAPVATVLRPKSGRFRYRLNTLDYVYYALKIIVATGIGPERRIPGTMSFRKFLAHMEQNRYPLRGVKRVAVIGAGNTGDVVVELLTGQGPNAGWPGSLDYVERIDWFGAKSCFNAEDWYDDARPRYLKIGSMLGKRVFRSQRRVVSVKNQCVTASYDSNRMTTGPYDLIINCTGFKQNLSFLDVFDPPSEYVYADELAPVARKIAGEEIYFIGPAAQLPKVAEEFKQIDTDLNEAENLVAIWRYGKKTAAFARLP